MTLNEQIALIVRETGWTLEYIRTLSFIQFRALIAEIFHQRNVEDYWRAHNAAMIICTLTSSKSHHYRPEEIIGRPPERRVMETNNLAKPAKLDKITLADGKEYKLVPLTIRIMSDLEEKFDKSLDEIFGPHMRMKYIWAMIYERLRPNYPELTEEQLGDLLTAEIITKTTKLLGV